MFIHSTDRSILARLTLFKARLLLSFFFLSLLWLGCVFQPAPVLVELGLLTPTPTPDPFVHYRAALQPAAQQDIEIAGPLPRYHITSRLADGGDRLVGVMEVVVPSPGSELAFRLYPNLDNYGGSMQVSAAQVNGVPVGISPLAGGTAVGLEIPPQANNNLPDSTAVKLDFAVELPRSESADYTLFGWDGPVLSLPGFYPTLAVRRGGAWVLEQPPGHGDVLFNDAALYQLDITLPIELVVVGSGVTLNVIDNPGDNSRTWQIAGGPLRDMTVVAGPFQAVSENAAGATVTAYYLPGHDAAAQTALAHAAASLRLYSDTYGAYPYTELDVVEAPLNYRGMEYSGLILIGEGLYREQREFLTFLVAHEVAHQWWYGVVGNDPYREPWLDEGLTEYSAFDYYRSVFGQSAAEELLTGRWFIPFDAAAGGGVAGVVDRPASNFDQVSYELLVYAKAALFFNALRAELGEEMYRQVLQTYYAENRHRIVSPATFFATAERVSGQNLHLLAEKWLR